jgi:hypothetical protein
MTAPDGSDKGGSPGKPDGSVPLAPTAAAGSGRADAAAVSAAPAPAAALPRPAFAAAGRDAALRRVDCAEDAMDFP